MDEEKQTSDLPKTVPASPDKVKPDTRQIAIVILCICILALSVVSLCLAHTVQKQKKTAKKVASATVQEKVVDDYKESKDEKKKIASMQDGFSKVTVGMNSDDMLKAIGINYDSKSSMSVADVPCTQYNWTCADNRYTMAVVTNNNTVIGKTQSGLFAPKTKVSQEDLQAFGDNAKETDIEGKYGKGVVASVLSVPGQDVQRVVFYGSKTGGSWVVVYSSGELKSVTGIGKDADSYDLNCTKHAEEVE